MIYEPIWFCESDDDEAQTGPYLDKSTHFMSDMKENCSGEQLIESPYDHSLVPRRVGRTHSPMLEHSGLRQAKAMSLLSFQVRLALLHVEMIYSHRLVVT